MNNLQQSSHNFFATSSLDRMSEYRLDEPWLADQLSKESTLFVPVWRGLNLFSGPAPCYPVFLERAFLEEMMEVDTRSAVFLGMKGRRSYFAIDLPLDGSSVSKQFSTLGRFQDLRKKGFSIDEHEGALLAYAKGLIFWHKNHLFCGKCGSQTIPIESGHVRVCVSETCKRQEFPRVDPAIIVLVTYGEKCLLARQPVWKRDRYSTIAGFVEPGESLEQAVVREVLEETGIHIDKVSYHSSQPWPFPRSIMLGFMAVAKSYDIAVDGTEIEDAMWFSHEDIYRKLTESTLYLPSNISISHNLIKTWFDSGHLGKLEDIMNSSHQW